jgi:tetratricopeptide (TPR) repeat protein
VDADEGLGFDYLELAQFEKSLEYFDRAIRLSPHDPVLFWYEGGKAIGYFGLKQYDQAIEWARRAIAIAPDKVPFVHAGLIAALVLTGRDAEAHEALQSYLALPSTGPLKTIAGWKTFTVQHAPRQADPRYVETWERIIEGLRKAGMS